MVLLLDTVIYSGVLLPTLTEAVVDWFMPAAVSVYYDTRTLAREESIATLPLA